MTQSDKELLLRDLCARLPYKVVCRIKSSSAYEDGRIRHITEDKILYYEVLAEIYEMYASKELDECKPYLRPMSSMTEEEKKEHDFYCGYKPYDKNVGENYLTEYDMPDYMDFLLEHHFDYRGLIEKGLALEAPEDMYNN